MNRYIALLRGINVGGHRKIKMARLRELFEEWGYKNVQTYIQSGNIIFDTDRDNPEEISKYIKTRIEENLGFDVPVILRTPGEFERTIIQNPFADAELNKTTKLYVTFLSEQPAAGDTTSFLSLQTEHEKFKLTGRELYVLIHKDKVVKQIFSNTLVEKKLGVSATNRNWNSVVKIYEMATS